MNQTWDLRALAQLRGCRVKTSDGVDIGAINEVVYDYESQDPVWIGIGPSRGVAFRILLVPIEGAVEKAGHLEVAFSADQIASEPPADLGAGFDSLTDQRHLYQYFAVPLDETKEVRVLRHGQDLPGLERTY